MQNPPTVPGIPDGDTILGLSAGQSEGATGLPGQPAEAATVPGLPAVWLAPNACLVQSHQPAPEGEHLVIQVVGVADYGN